MSHPITDRITEVKRKALRLAVIRSAVIVGAITLAVGFEVGFIDYFLRVEDPGTRVLLTSAWLGAIATAVWFWMRPVVRADWSDQTLAQLIERRFPALAGKLSSSLAFLTQADSFGSKPLMRNVIAETTEAAAAFDFGDAIDPRPTWRALGWLLGAMSLCGLAFALAPSTSAQALSRLVSPWKADPWPRVHHLRFVDPPKQVARGSNLRLVLEDASGNLPHRVDIQLRAAGTSGDDTELVPMQQIDDQMVLERTNVSRSFQYRATGGDDTFMPWAEVRVVEPPLLVNGSIRLTPPAYTGWQPTTIDQPTASLRVLEGSQVRVSARADRSLASGELLVRAAETTTRYAIGLSENREDFEVPAAPDEWSLEVPSEYSIHLTDREGTSTVNPEQWSIRVLRDDAPTLSLVEPNNEELVTPNANLTLVCLVQDDLSVRRVELRYLRTDQSDQGEVAISVWEGPDRVASQPWPDSLPAASDDHEIRYRWALESLKLSPGAVMSYHIVATDYKEQSSQTLARRLVVVSENDLVDRVGRRQSLILARLQQRLKQQRQAKQHLDAVALQLRETGQIEKATMDQLQSGLLTQRQVNSALEGPEADVLQELERLRTLLDRSGIGPSDVRTRVESTTESLQRIGRDHLAPALQAGSRAKQTLQALRDQDQASTIPDDVPQALRSASQDQAAVIQQLEAMLDDMSAWDNYRRFSQELNDLLRQQRDVTRATQETAKELLTREQDELDGQSRATLRSVSSRQLELARQMDRTLGNLSKAEAGLEDSDPAAAQMVRDALAAARESAVSGVMRQAGQQIDQNRLGLATQQQESAAEAIESMLDELSQRSFTPAERAEKMETAERELARLQKRQAELSRDFERANQEQDEQQRRRMLQRLRKRQQQLAQETRELQRQLQRLRADNASGQMQQASSSMDNAAADADRGDAQQAQEQSRLAEAQMEDARQGLQQDQQQAKSQLAQEQAVRLPQLVEALIQQQSGVVDEIVRLGLLYEANNTWTPGQKASLQATAEDQHTVAQDTALVAGQMSQLPAFVFALTEIQSQMEASAKLLDQEDASQRTQAIARRALEELTLLREMMRQPPADQPAGGDGGGSGGGGGGENSGASADFDARLAQLRLLREMQAEINRQTQDWNEQQARNPRDPRLDATARALAERQGKLAKVVTGLFPPRQAVNTDLPEPPLQDASDLDALDRELDKLLE